MIEMYYPNFLWSIFLLIFCISSTVSLNNLSQVSVCIKILSSNLSAIASDFRSLKSQLVFALDGPLFLLVFQMLFPKKNK